MGQKLITKGNIPKSNGYYKGFHARCDDTNKMYRYKPHSSFTIYCAGVSVECWLRAIITKHAIVFDEGHDLRGLLNKAIALDDSLKTHKIELSRFIDILSRYWHNGMRYNSEYEYRRFLMKSVKGIYNNSPTKVVTCAVHDFIRIFEDFFKLGVKLWT